MSPVIRAATWWRRRSLRARLTAAATVVVAALLGVAGVVLVWRVHASLLAGVDSTVLRQSLVVATAANGTDNPHIPALADEATVVQVVDTAGHVVAGSANVSGEPRLFSVPAPAGGAAPRLATVTVVPLDGARYRVAVATTSQEPSYRVYTGTPLAGVDQSTGELAAAVAVGGPALLCLLAGVTWLLVGRALRPVELLRRQAAGISATDLHRRVDVPSAADELAQLAGTLNGMLDRLEDSAEQQRRFVADAAHELRTPVAALLLQLETAERDPGSTGQVLGSLTAQAARLAHLVDELLTLARLDAAQPAPARPVDLDDLVLAEVQAVRAVSSVPVDITRVGAARVRGDAGALRRVVRNLLDNATRHAAGRVEVSLAARHGETVLVVADDGPGIRPADRRRVFERFGRLDDGRDRDAGGTGLGLAIVRETVLAHGGSVELRDNDPGLRVVVVLPAG